MPIADTPQFRGGNPYFFSEHLYQSVSFIYASMYRGNVQAINIAMQFAKQLRHCVINIDSHQQRTKIGAFHGRRNLPFFGNLALKASCVDDKTVLFRYTYSQIVFQ